MLNRSGSGTNVMAQSLCTDFDPGRVHRSDDVPQGPPDADLCPRPKYKRPSDDIRANALAPCNVSPYLAA
jgi:hypothetical protein